MKLLLHVCCAPCLIYPLQQLRNKGFQVSGLFYNPNIYPLSEYNNRRQALISFTVLSDIEIIYPEYTIFEFMQAVQGREVKPQRCSACWSLRLKNTARLAKDRGFDAFSTTLLVSPYQDQALLKEIGADISKSEGIYFYEEDFRPGFRSAHNQARVKGIYCQKYCGCAYSEVEAKQNLCRSSEKH